MSIDTSLWPCLMCYTVVVFRCVCRYKEVEMGLFKRLKALFSHEQVRLDVQAHRDAKCCAIPLSA